MTMLAGLFALTQDDPAWEAAQTNFMRAVRSLVPTAELNARPGLLLASLPPAQRTARPVLPLHLDIAGDLRLDNRAELIDRLCVSGPITDLDLVGLGYQRWGEETALRLEGDFAIAIHDRRNGKLICLRDPFGVRPLYYRQDGRHIAFATRQALLARRGDEPDHGALGRFLIGLDDDAGATVFSQVRRLPAAHLLVAGRDAGLAVRRYWSAEPFHAEGEDRAHLLLDRLDRAVVRRFAGEGVTGTLLSGGLDSSAITALAARNSLPARLQTYSFGYPGGSPFDERRYVDAVQRHHGLAVGFVPMDDFDPLGEIAELLHPLEDPVFAPGLGKLMRIYDRARADGIRVLLDGHGGDEVVSHGLGLLPELAHAGRWLELWKAAGAVENVFGMSRGALFSGFLLETRPARRLRRLLPRRGGERTGTPPPFAYLSPDLFTQDTRERASNWASDLSRARMQETTLHAWNISSPAMGRSFEIFDRAAVRSGVRLAFPFFDRAVVETALGIPAREKLRDGHTRHVMRLALAGIVPDAVRWRRDKVDFGRELKAGLMRRRDLLHAMSDPGSPLSELVDRRVLEHAVARFCADPDRSDTQAAFILLRCATLALWLERRRAEPSHAEHGASL